MATILKDAENALLAAVSTVATAQSLTPATQIAWPNNDYTPVVGTLYLEPRFLPNITERHVGASALKRYIGLFTVNIRAPINAGPEAGATLADALMEFFDRDTNGSFTSNGVIVQMGSPIPGQSGQPTRSSAIRVGAWSVIPVTVRWYVDRLPT